MTKREFKYHNKKRKVRFIKNVLLQLHNCGGKPIDIDCFLN